MKNKFKLLTSVMLLLTLGIGQVWGTDPEVICSATLHGIAANTNTTGVAQTGCTMKWDGVSASSSSDIVTIDEVNYYKLTGDTKFVQLILNDSKSFQAGDILTVQLTSNNSSAKSVAFKLNKSGNKPDDISVKNTEVKSLSYTLVAADIEDDGSIKILRGGNASTNARYGSFSVARSSGDEEEPADETAPAFVSSNPANGTTDVAVAGTIVLTFSEEIDAIDDTKFSLSGATIGTVAIDGTDATKVNVPYSGAANSATVTLSVAAGAVKDAANNALAAALSDISFTTVAAATTGTIDDLVVIDGEFTFEPTAALTTNTLYESNKIISLGGSGYNNGIQIKNNRQLAFKVAAGAKIVVTFIEKSGRSMYIGTTSAGNDLAISDKSTVKAIRSTAGIVYISASSDLYLTKLEISYPTLYTVTYNYNGGTLKEGESDLTEGAKETGETFTVASAAVLDAPEGKVFDKWNDGTTDYAAGATYTMGTSNVTLTAQWRTVTAKYAVTYDLGDYTAGVAPTEVDRGEGEVFALKAAPSWTDHDFMGWLCDIDEETYQALANYTMTAAATTFTAQWQAFFTITYKDGETVLDTEKVNVGSAPTGITEPTKELYSFAGWTLAGETDLVDPATLTENTVLVAKWIDFDGCAYLAVDLTETASLSVGDNIALKESSFGGNVKVAGMKNNSSIQYNGFGLYLGGGAADSLRVTINHQLQVGSKVTVTLYTSDTGNRSLNLLNANGGSVDGGTTLGWTSATANTSGTFSYTVKAGDGLEGKKVFRLQRNGGVFLKYITVEDCAPQDFTVTYKDGESTIGTEYVFENAHPTAADVSIRKNGFVFDGWGETAEGAVVDLNTITITADKTLYAKYTVRDCSGFGTKFKFQMKTNLTSGNVFSQTPNSVKATTANYLSELTGGEVEFSITGSNNNRILFYDEKAVGFANGTGGQITILLDCPLKENDEIRFINYASAGNKITLSDGTNSTTLDGNNKTDVQTFVVTAEWETTGSYELTMVREDKTPKLTYFEVYRPTTFDVSFDMMGHGSQVADITGVVEGTKIIAPTAPTDEDYAFAGWYKENTLENEWDFEEDVVSAATTLYAKWLDMSDATLKSLKYGAEDITLEEGIYAYTIDLAPSTTSVPVLTAETNNPNASAEVTNAAALDASGRATSTVVVSPQKEGAATQTYTVNFTVIANYARVDVTGTTEWAFSKALVDNTQDATLSNEEAVLANVANVKNNPAVFHSQALSVKGVRVDKGGYMQGGTIKFHTTLPGLLTVEFSNTGSSNRPYRELLINGNPTGAKSNTSVTHETYSLIMKSGDVELTARIYDNDGNPTENMQNVNFFMVKFTSIDEITETPNYTRDLQPGMLSTTCLPNGGVVLGASIFEIAYMDYEADGTTPHKIYFDEVENGEMEAGMPYIVLVDENSTGMSVFYTDNENKAARSKNGLVGHIGATTALAANDYFIYNNMFYYVSAADAASGRIKITDKRAYINLSEVPGYNHEPISAPAPGRRRMAMGNGNAPKVATGCDNVQDSEVSIQKVLIDGQMFILHGEKMYDVTGRLVK